MHPRGLTRPARFIAVKVLIVAAMRSCAADGVARSPLSLRDVVDRALCNNPQTRSAWANAKASAAQVGAARSAYLPTLSAGVSASRNRADGGTRAGGAAERLQAQTAHSQATLNRILAEGSARNAEEGYRSSYTVPMILDGSFWGFIFFNSRSADALDEPALRTLDVYAHLISAMVTAEMLAVRILAAAVKTAHDMVHYRDPETGAHIDRMARFARLIAQHLAATGAAGLDDVAIERIFEFAPLHDIGKLALPDRILLNAERLSQTEREEMKQHTVRGRETIEAIAHNFGLEHLDGLDLLRHIAESHHETLDGRGYPHGLHDAEILLEARIVAVADVFDALTSARPYKPSWSNDQAFAWLRKLARSKFDEDCVEALVFNAKKVREIQAQFRDAAAAR